MVSKHFDPDGYVSNSKVTLNYKCYSSWYFSNEITGNVVAMTSPPVYFSASNFYLLREYTITGFYGFSIHNTFHTTSTNKPWIQYDFGQVVQIQKILVKARNATWPNIANTWFSNVEARVGNVSSNGNFTGFALLEHYISTSGNGELVVFENSAPLWGRYVSLQSINDGFISFANINILGQV